MKRRAFGLLALGIAFTFLVILSVLYFLSHLAI